MPTAAVQLNNYILINFIEEMTCLGYAVERLIRTKDGDYSVNIIGKGPTGNDLRFRCTSYVERGELIVNFFIGPIWYSQHQFPLADPECFAKAQRVIRDYP